MQSPAFKPTVFVVHRSERRSKCSIEPLRGQPEFVFRAFPARWNTKPGDQELSDDFVNYVRLGIGGPLLTPADADRGLLLLDATWRYAAQMEHSYRGIPVRGL